MWFAFVPIVRQPNQVIGAFLSSKQQVASSLAAHHFNYLLLRVTQWLL
jgi:hypothetical protein